MNSGPCNQKMPYAPYHPLPLTSDAPEFELCINSDVRACTVMCALNVISIVIGKHLNYFSYIVTNIVN